MENFIYYIVLGIIYLALRAIGNKNKKKELERRRQLQQEAERTSRPQAAPGNYQPNAESPTDLQKSLQELLQEFETGNSAPSYEAPKEERYEPEYEDLYQDDSEIVIDYDDLDVIEEEKKRKVENVNPYLYQDLDVDKVKFDRETNRFDEFKIKRKKKSRYAKLFSDKNKFKDAFVMSEIMQRKF